MNIFEFFRRNNKSAKSAKERLQIVVSHQRAASSGHDFIPKLREELMAVICKYVDVDQEMVNVDLQSDEVCSVLELNVTLPKDVKAVATATE